MVIRSGTWTRRQFATTLAGSAVSSLLARRAIAQSPAGTVGFAFVGSMAPDAAGGLRVFRVSGSRWTALGSIAAASPGHLAIHPGLPMVYAVHGLDLWEHLPRGAVSAYRFDPARGLLQPTGTQPLSLGATGPRGAAVAADGRSLFVAAERGGIYNLLPLAADGTLRPVTAIRKELGIGEGKPAKAAAPCQVVPHADGSILTVDPGQETISSFRLEEGVITLRQRVRVPLGTGSASSLLMAPGGRFLIRAEPQSLSVLRVNRTTGELAVQSRQAHALLHSLSLTPDGRQLLGWKPSTGEIVSFPFDPVLGSLGTPQAVARVDACTSILLPATSACPWTARTP